MSLETEDRQVNPADQVLSLYSEGEFEELSRVICSVCGLTGYRTETTKKWLHDICWSGSHPQKVLEMPLEDMPIMINIHDDGATAILSRWRLRIGR